MPAGADVASVGMRRQSMGRQGIGRQRLTAAVIDLGVIAAWAGVLAAGTMAIRVARGRHPDWLGALGPGGSQALGFALLTGPTGLYLYLTESGRHQASLGKRRAGLRVTSLGGGRASRRQIALRTAVKLMPWETAHTFLWRVQDHFYRNGQDAKAPVGLLVGLDAAGALGFGYLAMVLARGRGPHDLVARTEVREGPAS